MRSLFQNLLLLAVVIGVGYYATSHNVLGYIEKDLHFGSLSGETSSFLDQFKELASKIPSVTGLPTDLPTLSIGNDTASSTPVTTPVSSAPANTTPAHANTPPLPKPISPIGPVTSVPIQPSTPVYTVPPVSVVGVLSVKGIIADTNAERASNDAAKLTESAKLDASAQVKAEDILKRQYFAHVAPDGTTVSSLVIAEGYTYIKIGENLALGGFTSDQDVVNAWMNSPEHKANMLDPQYQDMGVGIAYGLYNGSSVYVAVQHFGRPSSACPSPDQNLKDQVISGQNDLANLDQSLEALKAEIDQGRASGKDENANAATYNSGVAQYQAKYDQVETLRAEYNSEAEAYNTCIAVK